MDAKIKKCPNCSQFYHLKSLSLQGHGNMPLFLKCGHSMCENCIRNIIKFGEPIECKMCFKEMEMSSGELAQMLQNNFPLYKKFPVNIYMLGELAYDLIVPTSKESKNNDKDYFTELQSILQDTSEVQAQCLECHNPTTKICKQCETTLCNSCFNKIHKNFVIFKNHTLQNIDTVANISTCKTHKDKLLDYYCKGCSKAACMDCLMVGGEKSCKNHNVVSMQEMNEGFLQELTDITPKVEETYRRLTKTAVDIGYCVHNMDDGASKSKLTELISHIQQHFSQLSSKIQQHKDEVLDIILKSQSVEKESLMEAQNEVIKAIKDAQATLNFVKSISCRNFKQANIHSILEEAKKIADCAWYLKKDDRNEDPIKVTVNEDIIALVSDYIHLEGSANCKYELLSTKELAEKEIEVPPPPPSVVQPPELPKDVRENMKSIGEKDKIPKPALYTQVPKYRSKTGSCSSLNSNNSEEHGLDQSFETGSRHSRQNVQQVSPFPESQHPKQLHEGSQELIYITHIVDAHNFFVQRACHQPLVQDMQREFRNAVSLPKPSLNHIAEGKFYLVLNKADKMWQRCRLMSIDKKDFSNPRFHVFCIDFGSTEIVSIDKLRLLPPARVQVPPPFAINCSLANCEPKNGTWTNDDSFLIQNIIDNKQAVIHIRRIRSTSNYTVMYECDVRTYDDGVGLAHALVFHGRAIMPNPKLPYPKFTCGVERPKLYISHNDYKPNSVEEVYITEVVSPDHFYVRKQHLQGVYTKLCEDLEQEYSSSISTGSIYLPEIGMVCAVLVEKAGGEAGGAAWARGVVREMPGRGRVRVWLPDSGALLLLHWTALRRLAPHFATLRALAVECHLAGITPLNKKWSTASVALLQCYRNKLLELHVEEKQNRGSLGVTLYDKSDPENNICINQEMIKHKFAVAFGIFMFNKNSDLNDQVITNKSPLDKPKRVQKPQKKTITILKKPNKQVPKIKEKDLEAKDKGPLRIEVKILQCQSPSLFYVSLIQQQKTLNELFDKMQKYYSKKVDNTHGRTTWQVGDRCCTICGQSQTWRRAAILEINGDQAKVFYSDFACIETVPILSLRDITEDFASIGDTAIKCHLSGVIPAVGEEWPSLTTEFLKELIDAYKRIFITKHGNFKDNSMPVELWVYHTIQGGALEANTSEWRCLNKKIIEQGLGIPDKNQEFSDTQKIHENPDENMLSFLNMTGSINDWLQLEQLPIKALDKSMKIDSNANPHSSTPVDHDLDTQNENKDPDTNTIFISDWLPPEPLPSNEFIGMPTYIDNNGIIYLHSIDQQDTLDLIRKALDVRFRNPDPKAKFAKWTVGEPCIALFFLDNRFYRGRVLEVNNDESTCLIHYIDYGNEEICSFINLRKSIALYQIPIQAHKCVLDRIRPLSNFWDRNALDYIHKSVVEKECFVNVCGPDIEGVKPIQLKYNKLCINDHLVEFDMALYTDGSKAVTRKFIPFKGNTVLEEQLADESDSDVDLDDICKNDDANLNESNDTYDMETLKGKDWNELVEEQEKNADEEAIVIKFPEQNSDNFSCNIFIINDTNLLELTIQHNEDQTDLYHEMLKNLQNDATNMKPLNGIYENKACVAIFPEDDQWYRASILQYSKTKNLVKVKFIDYGNIEIVSPTTIREITDEYIKLPPGTVSSTLWGVKINPEIDLSIITEEYTNTFLDKGPFQCKIIDYDNSGPQVELRNGKGELVYEDLIKKNIFLLC